MGAASSLGAQAVGRLARAPLLGMDAGFKVTLTPSDTKTLGLHVTIMLRSDTLKVANIAPGGLVEEWNARHRPHKQVRPGLWIISVNGERGTASNMLRAIHTSRNVELHLSQWPPPTEAQASDSWSTGDFAGERRRFPVSLRSEDGIGPGIQITCALQTFEIQSINDKGAVHEWNRTHPDEQIHIGDKIVFLNGTTKADMLWRLWKDPVLHMVLRRGPPDEHGEVLPMDFVDRLPVVRGATDGRACGICLGDLDSQEDSMELPCKHAFHRDCVAEWLTKHSALCPFCSWAADHPAGASRCFECAEVPAAEHGEEGLVDTIAEEGAGEEVPGDLPALHLPASVVRKASLLTASAWLQDST